MKRSHNLVGEMRWINLLVQLRFLAPETLNAFNTPKLTISAKSWMRLVKLSTTSSNLLVGSTNVSSTTKTITVQPTTRMGQGNAVILSSISRAERYRNAMKYQLQILFNGR